MSEMDVMYEMGASNEQFDIDYAIVQAFERSKREERKVGSGRTFTIVLMAVFFVVLMVGLATGVTIYQKVAAAQNQTNGLHMQSGFLTNTVHVNDAADAVSMGTGPEGDALVLVERLDSGTFETRIYHYQGSIVQEYAIEGRPYNPANAIEIVESNVFEFSYSNGLLTLMTDQGSFDVALRSAQSGSPHIESSGAAFMAQADAMSGDKKAKGGA